jgi:hypothetical protein
MISREEERAFKKSERKHYGKIEDIGDFSFRSYIKQFYHRHGQCKVRPNYFIIENQYALETFSTYFISNTMNELVIFAVFSVIFNSAAAKHSNSICVYAWREGIFPA